MSKAQGVYEHLHLAGEKRLVKKLQSLTKSVEKRVVNKAARPAGHIVKNSIASIAPKLTGQLARTLQVRVAKKGYGVVVQTAPRSVLNIPPDSKWYYPKILEYGTYKSDRPIAPMRFMHRGLEAVRGQAMQVFIRNLWAGVKAEAAKK